MKCATFVFVAALSIFDGTGAQGLFGSILSRADNSFSNIMSRDPCSGDHVRGFEKSLTAFSTDIFKRAALKSDNHFVISPYSIWISLSAISEGADEATQLEYFNILHLPRDLCVRMEYYRIALDLGAPGPDLTLQSKRIMLFGNDLQLNAKWVDFVRSMNLLELTSEAKNNSSSDTQTLTGTSLLLDTLVYEGMWTTAFPNENVEISPFYGDNGKQIGTVELMRTKMKVRLAHLPILKAKVLELPVGRNGRYVMLFAMGLENVMVKRLLELYQSSFIVDILNNLIMSTIPIDIAIPKFTVASKYDARQILEEIGMKSIWYDPAATRYISDPAPVPSNYMQHVQVKIGTAGVNPPPRSEATSFLSRVRNTASKAATGLASAVGRSFIANKPFLYTLIDKNTKTILFTGAFSKTDGQV